MTPERWTGLAALLMEARDWLRDQDPVALDAELLDMAIGVCARERQLMVDEGGR